MSKFELTDRSNSSEIISINGYEIIERIGVGSYGRVYKVFKNKKYYVLKEIPLNLSSAAEKINSVQNEADILSSLNNKYVVKFYESFKKNHNIYIIMEYCDNGDLCSFLNRIKKQRKSEEYFLEIDFVWKLFIQMSIGLYYIHSKKIIHRDIKTLNIFLTKNFDAKIGDLGVAKILENTNHAMTFIGTPYYVSPEMCRNKPYNEKSDIWALGCILYELLTFNHPFTATNQAALFIKILNNKYNPFPPGVPEDLKNMVDFILEKDYELRPSMADIITRKSFQDNAIRLKLDKDLKNVLGIDILPLQSFKNNISSDIEDKVIFERKSNTDNSDFKNINTNNINTSPTVIIQLNSNKKNKDENPGKNKNQKSDLTNSKSLNDILKKYYMIKDKKEYKNKKDNSNYCISNKSCHSQHKIIRKVFQDSKKNKRAKSDFNCINVNQNNNINNIINQKKDIKPKENKLNINNINKKYINITSNKFIIREKNIDNINPKKTAKVFNNSLKIKENLEKKTNNNNSLNLNGYLLNIKNTNTKNNNYIKYCETSKNKIKQNSKGKKRNTQNYVYKTDIRSVKSPRIKKNFSIIQDKKLNQKNDIISESEFLSELQNTIKNTPSRITLNDLLNYNFNLNDSKNLNTTSATSFLGKIERPTTGPEDKYDLLFKNVEEEIEKEKENMEYLNLNGLCDEFTKTERIKRTEPYLSKKIPLSNYEIKINENKKELQHIDQMTKDELLQTNLIYKNQYEKYLEKIKKYEKYINLEEIKQIYKNMNNIEEKNIKIILVKIMNHLIMKKVPKENFDEVFDIIYNLISYELKHNYTEKAIKNS
jgi:NIMA (never in mitosis gene a)-related kinase